MSTKPYLPYIDGLRGLAVTAVVAYHCALPFSGGGFVGVDVFFVISGFLITQILFAEVERTGTLNSRSMNSRIASVSSGRASVSITTAHCGPATTPAVTWAYTSL